MLISSLVYCNKKNEIVEFIELGSPLLKDQIVPDQLYSGVFSKCILNYYNHPGGELYSSKKIAM